MVTVYCYSRCSTCQKALKWLKDNGVEHEVIDMAIFNSVVEIYKPLIKEYHTSTLMALA